MAGVLFDEQGAGRIIIATKRVEALPVDLTSPTIGPRGGSSAGSFPAQITALHNDYLSVRRVASGTPTGDPFDVAKPKELRHATTAVSNATAWTATDTNTADVTVDGQVYVHHVANFGFTVGETIMVHRNPETDLSVGGEAFIWEVLPGQRMWAGELEPKA